VLTHGEKEMKTSPEAKVYARGFHFTSQDAIECMVRLEYIVVLLRGEL